MEDSAVMGLESPTQYQERRKHLFPAPQSLEWYIRNHRSKLAECGALLLIAKRRLIDPKLFDAYVLTAGRQAAAASSEKQLEAA